MFRKRRLIGGARAGRPSACELCIETEVLGLERVN